MSDRIKGWESMPITDEICAAAEQEGLGLTEYIRRTYTSESLADLESTIKTQLDSLRGEISGFIGNVEVPEIEQNLMTASKEKLDMMQARVRRNMVSKITELDDMLATELSGGFMASQGESFEEEASSTGARYYAQPEGLLINE